MNEKLRADRLLEPEFWADRFQIIGQWISQQLFTAWSLTEIGMVMLCIPLAWLLARPLKPRLSSLIEKRFSRYLPVRRFLDAFARLLGHEILIALLWLVLIGFQKAGREPAMVDIVGSLLTAWVGIGLLSSVVRDPHWARFFAIAAWTVAALHILSLLEPVLNLLDGLAIHLGEIRLSVLLLIKVVIVLTLLLRLASNASAILEKRILSLEGLTPSVQVLLAKVLKITLLATAVAIALSSLGIDLAVFAFFGGAVGLGVGFGLQKVVSNLISGVILLLDKSIKPGDVIEVGDGYGRIQSLGARYVSVITRDGTEYLIPNEDLITQQVVNWSFSNNLVRLKIGVGVAYDSEIHAVIRLMTEVAKNTPRVLENPRPVCQLKNFGDNSIDMELRIWIQDPQNGVSNVSSAVRLGIWESFKANGIEIPFPQRDIYVKSVPHNMKVQNSSAVLARTAKDEA